MHLISFLHKVQRSFTNYSFMMYSTFQKIKFPIILSLFIFGFISCSKDEVKEPDATEIPDDVETQIKDFVWKSMNSW